MVLNTAEIGIIAGASVGIVGVVVPWLMRITDRGHEASLARAERLHAQRLTLYQEVARELEDWRL